MIRFIKGSATPSTFPGGEVHVNMVGDQPDTEVIVLNTGDGNELMQAAMASQLRREQGLPTALVCGYLPGARQDRHLSAEGRLYAQTINAGDFTSVTVMDPHSGFVQSIVASLVSEGANYLASSSATEFGQEVDADLVVAPDAGAYERAAKVADALGVELVTAAKERDPATGRITSYSLPEGTDLSHYASILAVDDICDGGATFLALAQSLRAGGARGADLNLWVTHGIFSNGLNALAQEYRAIGTTDTHAGSEKYRSNDDLPEGFSFVRFQVTSELVREAFQMIAAEGQ